MCVCVYIYIYCLGTVKISNFLNSFLHEVLWCAPIIILITVLQSEYLPTVCIHQLIVYSIDVNVLDGRSINTVKKNKL